MRTLPLLLLIGCAPATVAIDESGDLEGEGWATTPSETWTTEPPEQTDPYVGAQIRILEPASGDLLAWGQTHHFEARIRTRDGVELDGGAIEWSALEAPNWFERGNAFDTDALPLGIHSFTASVELADGSWLTHTIGAVRVQHPFAGTYAGLLDVDGTILNVPISCVGAGLIVIDPRGEEGNGDGDCLVSLLGADVPLHLIYELEIAPDGRIGGVVGVDLLGFFTYNFDAEGALDPSGAMDVTFSGEVPVMGPLSGSTAAERISLDTE